MKLDFAELENLVRAGQFAKVERALKSLAPKKIPRKDALAVANLARRINQFLLALRILNPIVRREKHSSKAPATEAERIEYAESLRKLGAVDEARQILTSIDGQLFPQTLLIQSFCFFSQWRYDQALPLLRNYVTSDALTDYQRLVGGINLAAALVQQNFLDEAAVTLEALRANTSAGGHKLLYGNSLELSAQLYLRRRDFDRVRTHLIQAEGELQNATSIELLWTRKWRAIADSLESKTVTDDLAKIRELSRQAGHWETFRDCSFHIGAIGRDQDQVERVYAGTPFAGYRENILREVGTWFKPPTEHVEVGETAVHLLDSETGLLDNGVRVLPAGQVHHRFLVLVASDLFRPIPLVAAFAQLFPDEYFNAQSSPARVHQAVKRLRKSIAAHNLNFDILEKDGNYRLKINGQVGLRTRVGQVAADSREFNLNQLLRETGPREFSVSQASQILGTSTSTSQRLLRWAVGESKLKVQGMGPRTRYQAA